MKIALKILTLIFIFFACNTLKSQELKPKTSFYMPPEWSPQEAVWLSWYHDFDPYQKPILDIAKALYRIVPLKMVAATKEALAEAKLKLTKNGIDTSKITFIIIEDNRLWMRDHGATFLINHTGQKKVVDFGWSLYGNDAYLKTIYSNEDTIAHYFKLNVKKTGLVDSIMGAIGGHSSLKTDVNMEGGSIEVNGKGCLILSESVTFKRNPTLSKDYIESEFKRVLGVNNIIWMKRGLAEDPSWFSQIYDTYYSWGTNGHTDEFVRFANENTILLAWVDENDKDLNPINKMNYDRMSENFAILEKARDHNGKPFNIIKVPLPDPIYLKTSIIKGYKNHTESLDRTQWLLTLESLPQKDNRVEGEKINWVACSSYLNYFVTNKAILLPTYINEGSSTAKEKKVKKLFLKLFPNKKLVFLDVMNLNYYGGGIHCVTQQEPKIKMQ
jgi:agmatine deiminase